MRKKLDLDWLRRAMPLVDPAVAAFEKQYALTPCWHTVLQTILSEQQRSHAREAASASQPLPLADAH